MEQENIYLEGLLLDLRVQTPMGLLTISELAELRPEQLDQIAISLKAQLDHGETQSLRNVSRRPSDKKTQLAFNIVVGLMNAKDEQAKAAAEAKEIARKKKERNAKIMAALDEKDNETIKSMSRDELLAMLEE